MNRLKNCSTRFTSFLQLRTWPVERLDPLSRSSFHTSAPRAKIKPFLLPDIGEGIKEVQIIQWFVQPEARVEQFDKLCEVQSDKAAAEITSRYDGVIKKIHYEAEEMAQVGKPLCDIDVQENGTAPQEDAVESEGPVASAAAASAQPDEALHSPQEHQLMDKNGDGIRTDTARSRGSLATPAVRGLLKTLNVKIEDVVGTGKDGRVLKEDVHKFAKERDQKSSPATSASSHDSQPTEDVPQTEKLIPLTRIQSHMFTTMTRSLSIPHFLYADEIDLTPLSTIRRTVNANANANTSTSTPPKLTFLPFIIKALSLALTSHPLLNSRVEPAHGPSPPHLIMRSNHNIGIAMDTPQGLLVPNIKNVSSLTIYAIATELKRLQTLGQSGKLTPVDLSGGTITVSNIGTIGGTYVAPLLVDSEVAILGIGRARTIPAFDDKVEGRVVKKEVVNFSWSADHRVVDGASLARMAECVRRYVEEPGSMMARLR